MNDPTTGSGELVRLLARSRLGDREAVELDVISDGDGGRWLPVLFPLLRQLAAELPAIAAVPLEGGAERGLLSSLARRWLACLVTVLYDDLRGSGHTPARFAAERLASAPGWSHLLARFPALEPLLDGSLARWRRHVAEMTLRLRDDAAALGLPRDRTLTAATVHGGEHEGRRLTTVVEIAGAHRLVYKDRDLRIGRWFLDVVQGLNERLSVPLHVRRLVASPTHAWDEFVARAPCADAAAVDRFYRRVGFLMSLLRRLGATDMHLRNVVGAGEHLAIIDLETLFQPAHHLSAAEVALRRSPLETGLLPFWIVGDPGRQGVEASALGRGGSMAMPYRVPVLRFADGDKAGFARDYAAPREAVSALPLLDGELVGPGLHVDTIEAGWAEMEALLARQPLPLAAAADLPIRVFLRPNLVYRRAMFEGLAPPLLADPAARTASLGRMLAGPGGDRWVDDPRLRFEVQTLADLRLPRFQAAAGRRDLLLFDGTAIRRFFATDGIGLTPSGAAAASPSDLELIRSTIALADPATRPRPGSPRPVLDPADAAAAIGELIVAHAIRGDEGWSWLGAAWQPWAGVRVFGLLPGDLLSGSAGIAIFLAALGRTMQSAPMVAAARAALEPTRRAALLVLPSLVEWGRDPRAYGGRWFFCGAYHGWGAMVFALLRCGALLGHAALVDLATEVLARFPVALARRAAPNDIALGLPGFILAALQAPDRPPYLEELAEAVASAADPPYVGSAASFLPTVAESRRWMTERLSGSAAEMPPDVAVVAAATRRHAETGSWLGEAVADHHHLSAVTGLAALGYELLRISTPSLGSLRQIGA